MHAMITKTVELSPLQAVAPLGINTSFIPVHVFSFSISFLSEIMHPALVGSMKHLR